MGFGEEEYGFDVGESVVDAGDVSFVLEVFDRSDAAEHKARPDAQRQVGGQIVVGLDRDARLGGIDTADGFDALGGGEKRAFVDVVAHAHHHPIEEREGASHDAGVPDGERVEAAGKEGHFFGTRRGGVVRCRGGGGRGSGHGG